MTEDNLVKINCLDCDENFIVGETSFDKHKHVNCPFCQSGNTEAIACTTDELTKNLDLGCMGIYAKE
jgi:Zn finger protein HypA/HybF involved in hydrogenase expression